jgi:hypothetical protein
MIAKTIKYNELESAVRVAFSEDKKIFELFDRSVKVETLDELVINVMLKIRTYENAMYRGVYVKGVLAGYFVFEGDSLISFGLNIGYRTRHILREFFGLMKKEMTKPFFCILWSRNVRAVKWLIKNGCKVNDSNPSQTQLVYT